jgi:hypothetical protein
MVIELVPKPGDQVAAAVEQALKQARIDVAARPASYGSAWRHAALAEGVERETNATEAALASSERFHSGRAT